MAETINSADHSSICATAGITGDISHMATPSSKTPKKFLTDSIQGPTLGKSAPADAPSNNNGTPIPNAMTNNADPPRTTSPVWLIYSSAPARGAATQGPTISADNAPMPN